jgi:nicotinate phosphoribosyltransferase
MELNSSSPFPEGVISFLDTDLYKLTMQCAVLKFFKDVDVTYGFTNRTKNKKLSREAFTWLSEQIRSKSCSVCIPPLLAPTLIHFLELGNISLSEDEYKYLQNHCPYLTGTYLRFLKELRLRPREQVKLTFHPVGDDTGSDSDLGDVDMQISGKWVETILYEIPILALTSEAYFKFMDKNWSYAGQQKLATEKGQRLLQAGCVFSEFGTRRRRDYHTQALVFGGLKVASDEAEKNGWPGKLSGSSNVHLAMRFNMPPVGTVAHEWFMGIAAIMNDYGNASEEALRRWIGCFGEGVLGIALTDTFGTPEFLKAFSKPIRHIEARARQSSMGSLTRADSFITAHPPEEDEDAGDQVKTYAQVFTGLRQDSGDPKQFVQTVRKFYDEQGIKGKKVIVFSDSLDIERCLEYKEVAEKAGFQPTFGIGTFFTNDFVNTQTGKKSTPLNIVIKLSSANGRPAVKIRYVHCRAELNASNH